MFRTIGHDRSNVQNRHINQAKSPWATMIFSLSTRLLSLKRNKSKKCYCTNRIIYYESRVISQGSEKLTNCTMETKPIHNLETNKMKKGPVRIFWCRDVEKKNWLIFAYSYFSLEEPFQRLDVVFKLKFFSVTLKTNY